MCGICGVLEFDGSPVDPGILQRMTDVLRHRGPDDEGLHLESGVGLGNRRLAVLDLTPEGHLPMRDPATGVTVAFNGEIYNFLEHRRALESAGETFRSQGDVEVLLLLHRKHGREFLPLLSGMFALALWDPRDRSLLLARDRLGKKPLYYSVGANRVVFASEIKALLQHPDVPRRLDRAAVPRYLGYGYVPSPGTIFRDIQALPPGSWLWVHSGRVQQGRYWDLPPQSAGETPFATLDEAAEAVLACLRESVRRRLVSDVPLGALLSGGLDSSAIVSLMRETGDAPPKTFAMGLAGEPSYNELAFARAAAEHIGTEHREFVLEPNAAELLPRLIWHLDQPFGDSSAIPTFLVSRATREHVTVALTGDGGDELFAGYERFRAARLAETYRRRIPGWMSDSIRAVLRRLPQSTAYRDPVRWALRFVEAARLPLPERYLRWVAVMGEDLVRDLLSDPPDAGFLEQHFRASFPSSRGRDPLPALLGVNMATYLVDDLLVKADRMSMAASLELRSPFLDHELVELAAQIPPQWKYQGGTSKAVLKRALHGRLPESLIRRRKHGFGVPIGRWFRLELRQTLRDTLLSKRALERGWFRPEALQRLVDEHQSGGRDHGHALWTLLAFEVWQRVYLEGEVPSDG